jgi:cation transport ATPase
MTHEVFGAAWVPGLLLNRWWQLALMSPVMFYAGWPIHRTFCSAHCAAAFDADQDRYLVPPGPAHQLTWESP